MANYIRIFNFTAASLFAALLLSSCLSDSAPNAGGQSVTFAAAVGREKRVDTRAGITFNPVQNDYRDVPFYIKAEVATSPTPVYETAQYMVAPGMMGRLSAAEGQEEILWYNKKDNHTFYAWTMPWQRDEKFPDDPDAESEVSFLPSAYQDMEGLSSSERINCGVMEHFIATRTDALNYNTNGELVEMYFQHLVSKININATRIVSESSDIYTENVEAYMTFLKMPQTGIFYRRPSDGKAPFVQKKEDGPTGVTCWIGNRTTTLYVCPEVDFAEMTFAIHINDGNGNRSDYYGDFKSAVSFKRSEEGLEDWDKDKSNTVLYAGEEMTINLVLRNNDVPNFTVNINKWSDKYSEGISHARNGVYTTTELQDIYNTFTKDDGYTQEELEEVFDMFGVEEERDGTIERVIYLYEDLKTSHTHFPLDKSLILDGLGHVLQMLNATRKFEDGTTRNCAHVPCCRNIFLTNGESMIYIDDNYRIWTVDPETLAMTATENYLAPRPLPSGQNSYYIDYATGEVETSSSI